MSAQVPTRGCRGAECPTADADPAAPPSAHLQAAWIFTSNDIKVNILVIVAALLVTATSSPAPDLVVGALIFLVVADGARRILRLSR